MTFIACYLTKVNLAPSRFCVNLCALLHKLARFLFHSARQRLFLFEALRRRVLPHVLRDLHRTKMRAAHRAEVRELRAFLWESFVVIFARDFRIEREVELIFPAKF